MSGVTCWDEGEIASSTKKTTSSTLMRILYAESILSITRGMIFLAGRIGKRRSILLLLSTSPTLSL